MSWFTHAALRRDTPEARERLKETLRRRPAFDAHHSLVWQVFDRDPEAPRDFIYREMRPDNFLIVSARAPEADPALWHLRSKPYAPVLPKDARFGFSLRVNPTVSQPQPKGKRGVRRDVLMSAKRDAAAPLRPEEREERALNWLRTKLERCGAELDTGLSQLLDYDQLRLRRKGQTQRATLSYIDVEGVLSVRDPDALQAALVSGIGHGRAFGLGLLLLRPLGD